MTTTYLEMPVPLKVNKKKFDLNYKFDTSPSGYGFIQRRLRCEPYWIVEFGTPALQGYREIEMQAFLDKLEGMANAFLAYDPRRPKPFQYMATGLAMSEAGTPTITGANYNLSTLGLAGFPPGYILMPGDYISYYYANSWWLYRVTDQCVANGAGSMAPVYVKPRPWLVPTSGTPLRMTRPCCAMVMLGGYQKDDTVEDGATYSWTGVQFIDRTT